MSESLKQYWNGAHEKYSKTDWINEPTLFAESVIEYFPAHGNILDAGCGQGQDSRFFASKGYEVTGIDFSPTAIEQATQKTPPELSEHLVFRQADLSEPLPFKDGEFDVVHSHLAAHYFSVEQTEALFEEFARVLKERGVLTLLLNSVHDSEYPRGERIEDDYFLVDGIAKRYFSAISLKAFTSDFEELVLDEQGETYKDRAIGNSKLVRFVGREK